MSEQTPFHIFIELIALDQKVNALTKEITIADNQLAKFAQQRTQLDSQLQQVKQHIHDVQKNVDAYELEMKDLDAQEQSKKRQLEQLTSHREYPGIKSEIDFLKKKQHELEETLVQVWNELENAKKDFAQRQADYQQKSSALDQENAALSEKKKTLQQELETISAQREPLQAQVPAQWMQKYVMMRAKVTDPVVPVVQKICSACYYPVSEQDMIALSHRKLVQCRDCFRLQYLPESQPAAKTDTSTP